jgi:D-galactarolactone cycloisomerase
MVERLVRLYCNLTESPFGDWYQPVDGYLADLQGPDLGIDPDPALPDKLTVA